jgi:hypothetical protein
MWRAMCRSGQMLSFVGIVAVSGTGANGGEGLKGDLHFACTAADSLDPSRVAAICAEFAELLSTQPGLTVLTGPDAPASGPALEIFVKAASDTVVELKPTWTDASGQRTASPSAGLAAADITLTAKMRQRLYRRILSTPPF